MSWDRAAEACDCDHQCEYHRFKARKVGEGDTCLLVTRDIAKMLETHYLMSAIEAGKWSDKLCDIDIEKFEQLLVEGKTLEQAYEALT